MSATEVLLSVRELISTYERWTKWELARNKAGAAVLPEAPEAVCFCLHGAICCVCGSRVDKRWAQIAIEEALKELGGGCYNYANFNDTHSHEEVLALVDRAVELLSLSTNKPQQQR